MDPELSSAIIIESLDHLVINVRNVEVSAAWYTQVLGMTRRDAIPAHGTTARTSLHFGQQKINLRPLGISKEEWFTADHETAGSEDLCFITQATPEAVADHLRSCGVAIEVGPVKRSGARGEITSIYCRDPDGSLVEISSYEMG